MIGDLSVFFLMRGTMAMIMPSRLNFLVFTNQANRAVNRWSPKHLSRTAASDRVDLSAHVEATTIGEKEACMTQGRVEGACESSYP